MGVAESDLGRLGPDGEGPDGEGPELDVGAIGDGELESAGAVTVTVASGDELTVMHPVMSTAKATAAAAGIAARAPEFVGVTCPG